MPLNDLFDTLHLYTALVYGAALSLPALAVVLWSTWRAVRSATARFMAGGIFGARGS